MPVIEQEQIESIIAQVAASGGQLTPEKARILLQFLKQINERARVIYDSAITLSAQMYDREEIARFWKGQREFLEAQLVLANRIKRRFGSDSRDEQIELNLNLDSLIATLEELVIATSEHYEFHA